MLPSIRCYTELNVTKYNGNGIACSMFHDYQVVTDVARKLIPFAPVMRLAISLMKPTKEKNWKSVLIAWILY